MKNKDVLYGNLNLPEFIQELIQTPQVQRLRNISQDSLPQECIPWRVPTRFEHCIGTCALALDVITNNPKLRRYSILLPVAALLHDAGNPPFTHLSEPFLKKITGKDGESFLEEILDGSEASRVITRLGLSTADVVNFVTGNTKPFSTVLNGSMDIDNLDNIARYLFVSEKAKVLFDARKIANAYRFSGSDWELDMACFEDAQKWQKARRSAYKIIYGCSHLNIVSMIHRALDIAFLRGELSKDFFYLNDMEAINFLYGLNDASAFLVDNAFSGKWYPEIISIETERPGAQLKNLIEQGVDIRSMMAEYIREQMRMPAEAICVYAGKGRDKRKIDIPFVGKDGSRQYDTAEHRPLYRVKVYVHPDFKNEKQSIEHWVKYMIN